MGLRVNCGGLSACPITLFSGAGEVRGGGLFLLVSASSGCGDGRFKAARQF